MMEMTSNWDIKKKAADDFCFPSKQAEFKENAGITEIWAYEAEIARIARGPEIDSPETISKIPIASSGYSAGFSGTGPEYYGPHKSSSILGKIFAVLPFFAFSAFLVGDLIAAGMLNSSLLSTLGVGAALFAVQLLLLKLAIVRRVVYLFLYLLSLAAGVLVLLMGFGLSVSDIPRIYQVEFEKSADAVEWASNNGYEGIGPYLLNSENYSSISIVIGTLGFIVVALLTSAVVYYWSKEVTSTFE